MPNTFSMCAGTRRTSALCACNRASASALPPVPVCTTRGLPPGHGWPPRACYPSRRCRRRCPWAHRAEWHPTRPRRGRWPWSPRRRGSARHAGSVATWALWPYTGLRRRWPVRHVSGSCWMLADGSSVARTSVPVRTTTPQLSSWCVGASNNDWSRGRRTSSRRNYTKVVRSCVAKPQNRRKLARSSSALARRTLNRSCHIDSSSARNSASGGQLGSPLDRCGGAGQQAIHLRPVHQGRHLVQRRAVPKGQTTNGQPLLPDPPTCHARLPNSRQHGQNAPRRIKSPMRRPHYSTGQLFYQRRQLGYRCSQHISNETQYVRAILRLWLKGLQAYDHTCTKMKSKSQNF